MGEEWKEGRKEDDPWFEKREPSVRPLPRGAESRRQTCHRPGISPCRTGETRREAASNARICTPQE